MCYPKLGIQDLIKYKYKTSLHMRDIQQTTEADLIGDEGRIML